MREIHTWVCGGLCCVFICLCFSVLVPCCWNTRVTSYVVSVCACYCIPDFFATHSLCLGGIGGGW